MLEDDAELQPTPSVLLAADVPASPRPGTWYRHRVNVITAMKELWQFRELIRTLAERDLRARYKQAVLGVAWAVMSPVMLLVLSLILHRVARIETGSVPYAV